jgi:alanine racemase
MTRSAIAILSTQNLHHNLEIIKKKVPGSGIIAMVKANAYGHGIRSVAKRLCGKVSLFGVASIDEALALRKVGIKDPILLSEGVFEPNELVLASVEGFHVVFHEHTQLEWLKNASLPLLLNAWIKVDTGMGRLGFFPKDIPYVFELLKNSKKIAHSIPLISHLACSDEKGHPLNAQQIQCFEELARSFDVPKTLCSAAGIFNFPQQAYQFVRPGIALYGVSPILGQTALDLDLKPVITLRTSLIAVREVPAGTSIGYGATYRCTKNTLLGVIAFGYGDGYPRSAPTGTPVLIHGKRCPIIGRISMDMITVDLSDCPKAQVGDCVILFGEGLLVEEVARCHINESPYALITNVQHRVRFHWTNEQEGDILTMNNLISNSSV